MVLCNMTLYEGTLVCLLDITKAYPSMPAGPYPKPDRGKAKRRIHPKSPHPTHPPTHPSEG